MKKLRLVEAVQVGNVTFLHPKEHVLRVDLWKRGGFKGSSLHVGRIPIAEDGVSDERFIGALVMLGVIEERSWIPIRSGDLLSIVDVDTDFEEYQCQFSSKDEERSHEIGLELG